MITDLIGIMWHEARRSEKKVHDMMDAARKRAQRRAVYLAKRRGDPQQSIQAVGSRCRIYRDDALYHATQDQQGLYESFTLIIFSFLLGLQFPLIEFLHIASSFMFSFTFLRIW